METDDINAIDAKIEFTITIRFKSSKLKTLGISIIPNVIIKVISHFFKL